MRGLPAPLKLVICGREREGKGPSRSRKSAPLNMKDGTFSAI